MSVTFVRARRVGAAVARHAPTVLTLGVLAALFWWGHHHGWSVARPTPPPALAADAWCPEHHVPEAVCLLCRKHLGRAQADLEPAAHRAPGEKIRFAQVASPEVLAKTGITVATAVTASLAPQERVAGETRYAPDAVTRVSGRSAGRVRSLLVGLGDPVAAGAVVAVLESAAVGQAKAAFMQAVVAHDLARTQVERLRTTTAAGIRPVAEREDGEARLRQTELALHDAAQALRQLGLEPEPAACAGLDTTALVARLRALGLPPGYDDGGAAHLLPVRAPRAGVVTEIRAVSGETVEADAPVLVLADPTRLWASLPLTPARAAQVAVGQAVTFVAADGTTAIGQVSAIAPAADEQTRLVTVWASLDNAARHLRVGVFGQATITTGPATAVTLVPAGALQFDGDQAHVFVRRSDTIFRALPVRVLMRHGDQVAIDRLSAGEVVAAAGTGVLFAIAFQERMGAGCCAPE